MAGSPPNPLAVGVAWAYRAMSVSLELCLPALVGAALDRRLGSTPWATVVGAVLGLGVGVFHLTRMAASVTNPPPRK
jgi:F0F1-type ATP synthase assembly protein I